jgi:hypothetical protein
MIVVGRWSLVVGLWVRVVPPRCEGCRDEGSWRGEWESLDCGHGRAHGCPAILNICAASLGHDLGRRWHTSWGRPKA